MCNRGYHHLHIVTRLVRIERNHPRRTVMPLIRISMKKGTSAAYRKAIVTGIYEAMRATFNVP